MRKILVIILCLLAFAMSARAEEEELIQGNTIVPVQKRNVRLLSEEVHVSSDSHVSARYVLENLSNEDFTMKVGFPYRSPGPKDLKVIIQDHPVEVKQQMSNKGELIISDEYSGFRYDMFVWNVFLPSKQKMTIKVDYIGHWGYSLNNETALYFVIATSAGKLWQGDIKKADFFIDLDKDAVKLLQTEKSFNLIASPDNYKYSNNQVLWHFENWKPNKPVSVGVMEKNSELKKTFEQLIHHTDNLLARY